MDLPDKPISSDEEFISKKTFLEIIHKLEDQIRSNNAKIETLLENTDDRAFKSFKGLKKELRAFFSIRGYSEVLKTRSISKKILWLICMIALFATCMFYTSLNYKGFLEFNVVTQIKQIEVENMTYPAITICLADRSLKLPGVIIPISLRDVLVDCTFEKSANCSFEDFANFQVHTQSNQSLNCYQFNGVRNESDYRTQMLSSSKFGSRSGLYMQLNYSIDGYLNYYVGDNFVRPLFSELANFMQPGKAFFVGFKKTSDSKLPEPFSRCRDQINSGTSHLVKKILDQNFAYRKIDCYDLCVNEYASSRNLSKDYVYWRMNFDYEGNCSRSCPLECNAFVFDTKENSREFLKNYKQPNFLQMFFFFSDNKYIELTQIEKTSVADLVSNTGGVLGLFLDLTFISAYKMLVYFYDLTIFRLL